MRQAALTFDLQRSMSLAGLKIAAVCMHRALDERLEVGRGWGSMFIFGLLQVFSEFTLITRVLRQDEGFSSESWGNWWKQGEDILVIFH